MLFHHSRSDAAFQRTLLAAIAARRPAALRALLASRGEGLFARALAELPGPLMAEALSQLSEPARLNVFFHLPRAARERLSASDGAAASAPFAASWTLPFGKRMCRGV